MRKFVWGTVLLLVACDGGGEGTGTDTDGAGSATDVSTTTPAMTASTTAGTTAGSTTGTSSTTNTTNPATTSTTTSTTVDPSTTTVGDGSSSSGEPIDAEFEEVDGIVSVEAEHYFEQANNEPTAIFWYTFADGEAPPEVECVTNTPCGGAANPNCNQYADCDPDAIDRHPVGGGEVGAAGPTSNRYPIVDAMTARRVRATSAWSTTPITRPS